MAFEDDVTVIIRLVKHFVIRPNLYNKFKNNFERPAIWALYGGYSLMIGYWILLMFKYNSRKVMAYKLPYHEINVQI